MSDLWSWASRSNRFPHTTFNWVGIDGTQVLAHMTPVGKLDIALRPVNLVLMPSICVL